MKKGICFIIILSLVAAYSCKKKKYPEAVDAGATIFYSKLLVNGEPLEINAGKNGYYMYSSYLLDSSNVYNFIGEFKQAGCSNCTNSLRIQINDFKFSGANGSIDIDSALMVKSYSFLKGSNDVGYQVDFTGSFNKSVSSLLWDFGDGTQAFDMQPTHIFKAGKYNVSLLIIAPDKSQSTLTNTLSILTAKDLNLYVSSSAQSNTVSFASHPYGGTAPYTYFWEFGDGTTSTNANPKHPYSIPGGYTVKLKISDSRGKTTNCLYNALAGGIASASAANITFSLPVSIKQRFAFSKASIQFTNANGVTYSSDNALQPDASDLEIISVEEFVKNENNQSVKKLKLKFNCTLYSGSQSISLQGTEVVVGVAYK